MPKFLISVANETFNSSDRHEAPSANSAKAQALEGVLQIGAAEVIRGKQFFAAEVKVEEAGATVERFLVSIGTAPLMIAGVEKIADDREDEADHPEAGITPNGD